MMHSYYSISNVDFSNALKIYEKITNFRVMDLEKGLYSFQKLSHSREHQATDFRRHPASMNGLSPHPHVIVRTNPSVIFKFQERIPTPSLQIMHGRSGYQRNATLQLTPPGPSSAEHGKWVAYLEISSVFGSKYIIFHDMQILCMFMKPRKTKKYL